MLYANVIVRSRTQVEELTYSIPAHIIPYLKVGSMVTVPLRRKSVTGVVVELKRRISPELQAKVRDILTIDKRGYGFSPLQIDVIRSLAKSQAVSLGEVASSALVLPAPIKGSEPTVLAKKRPIIVQGTWPKRLASYLALVKKHEKNCRLLFIFSQANRASQLEKQLGDQAILLKEDYFSRKKPPVITQKIVIGTLSAVFYPLEAGDYIIVDQPDELGLEQQQRPYLSAKQIVVKRVEIEGLQAIFGSTLASLDDTYLQRKSWRFFTRPLPHFDLTVLDQRGSREPFLPHTLENIAQSEKTLIFTGTKGQAGAVICGKCGYIPVCTNCGRTLVVTSRNEQFCHFCNLSQRLPQTCPKCYAREFRELGYGTTKITEELKKRFPTKKIAEISSDTTVAPTSHDIVVATEKIFSFTDLKFESVILVNIDRYLSGTESNQAWRFMGILLELAEISERQLAQTYLIEHWAWGVTSGRIRNIALAELKNRQRYHLPPFGQELIIKAVAATQKQLEQEAKNLTTNLEELEYIQSIADIYLEKKSAQNVFAQITIASDKRLTLAQINHIRTLLPPAWRLVIH